MSKDGKILCIPHKDGYSYNLASIPAEGRGAYYDYLHQVATGIERSQAETDPSYKQIIPYIVIHGEWQGQDYVLCGRRLRGGNEDRLHGRITLGLGGHVKWEGGLHAVDMIYRAAEQELKEEVGYVDPDLRSKLVLVGELDADVTDVDLVHRGLVYLLTVDLSDEFWLHARSQEPDKLQLFWAPLNNLGFVIDRMEEWAKLTYGALVGLAEQPG